MATKANRNITYRDLVSGLLKDGSFDTQIIELMMEENPMLDDMVVREANDGTSNKTTIRTGIPDVAWIGYYDGVQASKGTKRQIRNTAGRMATKLEIDKKLWDAEPNKDSLLLDEIGQHQEAMSQEMATCLLYGTIGSEPKAFNGLGNFYSVHNGAASTDDKVSSHYVFNAKSTSQASTAALRSIWLVGWGDKSIRAFYPQGTSGGMERSEFKDVEATDPNDSTKTYEAKRQYLYWSLGLDVRDYRYGGRLCNLQADEMFDTSGVPDYVELLTRLHTRVKDQNVKQAWYMDKLTFEAARIWLTRKTMGNAVEFKDVQQRMTNTIFGIPVRISDALNTNETEVAIAS